MQHIVQVGLLTAYLRELVESDELLQDLWVEGEVSSFTVAASGHAYFTIKDEQAAIDCVMWRALRLRQSFQPRVGDKIIVHGSASVYERASRLQVKADVMHPAGAGLLQLQLERLRQQLEAEGLFDPSRKRPLPVFPRRIGVVTSSTGAVLHDIQRVLERRYPLTELVLCAAVMQGEHAPVSIVDALDALQLADIDVIIVARGGGSAEDLWCFNDERIARAIFASAVPVVSAIGHETDTTIADLVADVRASTPSVAAEIVTPDIVEISRGIDVLLSRAHSAARARIEDHSQRVVSLQHRLGMASPRARLETMRATVEVAVNRLVSGGARLVERKAHAAEHEATVLRGLDPVAILGRGYAHLALDDSGTPLRTVSHIAERDLIHATLVDGDIRAAVISVRPGPGAHS